MSSPAGGANRRGVRRELLGDQALSALERYITTKAWKDEGFRRELLNDPKAVAARELGIIIPAGIQIEVHEENRNTLHFVLPMNPLPEARDVSSSDLLRGPGENTVLIWSCGDGPDRPNERW